MRKTECGQRGAVGLAGLLVAILLVPLAVSPGELPTRSLCLFRIVTGIPCPFCGLTHSFLAAGRGWWSLSFACHPLGAPIWLALLGLLMRTGASLLAGRPARGIHPSHALAGMLLLLLAWILRDATGALARL